MEKKSLTCLPDAKAGVRLDRFMQSHLPDVSRNQLEKLIKKGMVRVDDAVVTKPGYRLKAGQAVAYEKAPKPEFKALEPDFDVAVIYEDDDLMVINKPSGVVVHGAPSVKEPTLVDWLVKRGVNLSTVSGEERHGIVHRLDKETSGAMVIAKNNRAHMKLAEQLKERSMGRYYVAVIDLPLKESLEVDAPIARNPANRLKMGVVSGGRPAKTRFEKLLLDRSGRRELIGAKLYSGRTHQIRVHLASLQRHILGDYLYGFKSKEDKIKRILLHAYILYLIHPVTGESLLFLADIPMSMAGWINGAFEKEKLDEVLDPSGFLRRFGDDRHRLFHQGAFAGHAGAPG